MTNNPIPLLWLCGPSGVGKSTVGWQLFCELTKTGIRVGYLDIDQLGMCYPASASDPERHRIKGQNLGTMVTTFQAAGAECIIVSGVVDEIHGIRSYVDQISQTALTLCRLRASHPILSERLVIRGWDPNQMDAALRESDTFDKTDFADICIDTDGLPVSDVIQHLRKMTNGWPARINQKTAPSSRQALPTSSPTTPTTPGSILWLCGTTGVGKSTVGWQIFEEVRRSGITAAFVDLEQIGFCRPVPDYDPDNHFVKAQNLAAMWQNFQTSDARCFIVVGPVNHPDAVQTYTDVLPERVLTLCRLHAGLEQLMARIMRRGQGAGPRLAGDALAGRPAAALQQIAEAAARNAELLEREAVGDFCINTDDRTIVEVARAVQAHNNGFNV